MARPPIYLRKIDEWVIHLEELRYAQGTCRKSYPSYARLAYRALKAEGLETDPSKIGKAEVLFVVNNVFRNQGRNIAGWNNFLKFCGNPILEVTEYAVATPTVMRADWLNLDACQDLKVWDSCRTTMERMVIHLELHLCMRNIEVRRQLLSWFGPNEILVLGKGRYPGKPRRIPYHTYTQEILAEVASWRMESADTAGEPMPDHITAYWDAHAHRICVPGETALRNVILRISERSGIKFSHHTLRRTGARRYWKAGAKLENIQKLLGHESINQTRQYIGIDLDDTRQIIGLGQEYDDMRRVHQTPENLIVAR